MGYTHYFQQLRVPSVAQWNLIKDDAKAIIETAQDSMNIPLAWEYNEHGKPPEVSEDLIRFNGVGSDGHETFYLPRVMEKGHRGERYRFNFCKTACKPYDAVVGAVLLSMWVRAPKCWDFASDGEWENSGWQEAYQLYRNAISEQELCPAWLISETV